MATGIVLRPRQEADLLNDTRNRVFPGNRHDVNTMHARHAFELFNLLDANTDALGASIACSLDAFGDVVWNANSRKRSG